MYYKLIRKFLFLFDPEWVHHLIFNLIKFYHKIPFVDKIIDNSFNLKHKSLERNVFGINFPNPVGLAAGFDKDAKLFNELSCYGFGFIEIGTVTPLPQKGNPKPRIFRLKKDKALINRLGFNNDGTEIVSRRLLKNRKVLIGGNIGKNKETPNQYASDDYIKSFNQLFDVVDYFVVNVSSPNTPKLRSLQSKKPLKKLLTAIQNTNNQKSRRKPILVKISPDLSYSEIKDIIDVVLEIKIDGVIATNTTLNRENLKSGNSILNQEGGLSGVPLKQRSNDVIQYISKYTNRKLPIIGVGGINSAEDAVEKIKSGATLVQIYTGFIYQGPSIVKKINKALIS